MHAGATLTAQEADAAGDALYEARRSGVPIEAFTAARPELGMLDGYAIQQRLVERLVADGEEIIGYKLGLTSKPMQELLGVDQPDFGPVFASVVYADGAQVSSGSFIAPRVEAEIAVTLGTDLSGPHCTTAQAKSAIAGATAAIEIVDSRIKDWKIKLADTIADLASNGAIVLGGRSVNVDDIDLRLVGMVFSRNGEIVATGAGAAALGDPAATVAWLANTLHPLGVTLRAGQVIMTGALHAMVPLSPGDVFRADFDHLGSVTIRMA